MPMSVSPPNFTISLSEHFFLQLFTLKILYFSSFLSWKKHLFYCFNQKESPRNKLRIENIENIPGIKNFHKQSSRSSKLLNTK